MASALTPHIGRDYRMSLAQWFGNVEHDSRNPVLVVQDHGIGAIVESCDDEAQIEHAMEATANLYPPLVCKVTPDAIGGVVIPVIQN